MDKVKNNDQIKQEKKVLDEKNPLSLGDKINKLRKKRCLTQAQLAKKINTSRTAIARYENSEYSHYNLSTLSRIAKALNAELDISFNLD